MLVPSWSLCMSSLLKCSSARKFLLPLLSAYGDSFLTCLSFIWISPKHCLLAMFHKYFAGEALERILNSSWHHLVTTLTPSWFIFGHIWDVTWPFLQFNLKRIDHFILLPSVSSSSPSTATKLFNFCSPIPHLYLPSTCDFSSNQIRENWNS